MDLDKIIKDEVERLYFEGLLSQLNVESQNLYIHTDKEPSNLFPTAIAPKELLKEFPVHDYSVIRSRYKADGKVDATLWLKKMHGGMGSSIERTSYLKKYGRNKAGAKGTDLFIKTSNGEIPIAVAQIIQAIKKKSRFSRIIYQDIINEDVSEIFYDIWKDEALNDIERFSSLVQTNLPTIDENGKLTTERVAPAGHGLFGFEAIYSIFEAKKRPQGENIIACIGNGEDLSSTPDRSVTNWMIQERIPICMITTTKTQNDMKGGQISIIKKPNGKSHLTIIEKAQAVKSNQLDLFEELGLRKGDSDAFFNTNLVLINIDVLCDLFKNLNKDKILSICSPDLIQNTKIQDGKEFIQLEGAMGSVFLNLDAYWREVYGKPIVHILNIPLQFRTRFFSPIKKAFDYFMQFHSDRYSFNEETFHLKNNNPNNLPQIILPDDYNNVANVLEDFEGTSIINLDKLILDKRHNFKGQILKDTLKI